MTTSEETPLSIPTLPVPNETARARGWLVGAVVRGRYGYMGQIVAHKPNGEPLIQWFVDGVVSGAKFLNDLALIRSASERPL